MTSLEELLGRIAEAAREHDEVSLGEVIKRIGRRSFGPLLLVAGLLAAAPVIGDIPSVPTITGLFVVLVSGQLVLHREHFWLPRWLLRRSISRRKLCKALEWMRRPARFVDRLLRPRLEALTHPRAVHAMAVVCLLIALAMPTMEVIPLVANLAGAAFVAFGLSLIAHDGLLALLGFSCTALTVALAVKLVL